MRLNRSLAQKIVENTVHVLGRNINIMNHQGIIIGSGDLNRIDTFHEIAYEVIRTEAPFIIKREEIDKFKGVKEGINLPIIFHDSIIGVVGITGRIEEVSGYGQIVKNMVELILEQEFLRQEIELNNRALENFYQQLITNNILDRESLKDRIKLFKINPNLDRVVFLISFKSFDNQLVTNAINKLNNLSCINNEDIFLMWGDNLVLIKALNFKGTELQNNQILNLAKTLEFQIKKFISAPIIGIGRIVHDLSKLHLSYEEAKFSLEIGNKVYRAKDKEKRIFYINNLGCDYILPFIDYSHAEYYLHNLFDRDIERVFSETDIGDIIESLVDNNLNISKAAEELYIHRNTLLYRIKKIEKDTGLNIKNSKDLFTLLLAYHLYLFNK
jgi:carbohydrate diacid regulator